MTYVYLSGHLIIITLTAVTLTAVILHAKQYMNIKDELNCVTNEIHNVKVEKDQRVSDEKQNSEYHPAVSLNATSLTSTLYKNNFRK